jgi:hypothetical protein
MFFDEVFARHHLLKVSNSKEIVNRMPREKGRDIYVKSVTNLDTAILKWYLQLENCQN